MDCCSARAREERSLRGLEARSGSEQEQQLFEALFDGEQRMHLRGCEQFLGRLDRVALRVDERTLGAVTVLAHDARAFERRKR